MRAGQYQRQPPLELGVDLLEGHRRTRGERLQWMMKILRAVHYVDSASLKRRADSGLRGSAKFGAVERRGALSRTSAV
jgi:hypothetical protein